MKPRAESKTIAIPPALVAEIQAAAYEEKRPAEEILREAIPEKPALAADFRRR
jgi:hypothetical protein